MGNIPEQKSVGDAALQIGRAIVSAVPLAGGPLQVLLENVFKAPLEKRQLAWLHELEGVVRRLQEKIDGFTPDKLSQNESFITVALQATQIAIRNHQQEKIHALRNAVLNSGLPNPPDENEQLVFLKLVDQLTPWHLGLLGLLDGPLLWMNHHGVEYPMWELRGLATVVEHCLPQLRGKRETYDQLFRDLQTSGLLMQGDYLHGNMTGSGKRSRTIELDEKLLVSGPLKNGEYMHLPYLESTTESRTTATGKRFLKYITEI